MENKDKTYKTKKKISKKLHRKQRIAKRKKWLKKNKIFIFAFLGILAFPIIVGLIYAIPIKQVVMVESGDLLGFYSTVFGFFVTAYIFFYNKRKSEKEKLQAKKPKLALFVDKVNDIYSLTLKNLDNKPLYTIFIFDRFSNELLEGNSEINIKIRIYDNNPPESNDGILNIIDYDGFLDENGIPKYFQFLCDDVEGDTWNCCFDPVEKKNLRYYPSDFSLT